MKADPILLQMKYARIITKYAEKKNIPYIEAMDFFYHSYVYKWMKEGISDMHCMSDDYLVEELCESEKS